MKTKALLLLFLAGCMVGPNYQKKEEKVAASFIEKRNEKASIESLKSFWETFNDPKLNELVNIAITNNYNLKIALEKIEESRAYYRLKKADLFPEIDLKAAALREGTSKNLFLSIPPNTFSYFKIGFDAIWEIDLFGKLRREKEAASYAVQAEVESMRDVYITIISDVAKNYVDICALNNLIALTQKKVALQKKILFLTKNLKTNGLDSQIEVENSLNLLKEDEENIYFYNTLIKQNVHLLAVLLGQSPEESMLKDFKEFKKIPDATQKISVGMPSTLLRRRPDIRMAERTLAEKTALIGAAIAEYFPSFSLVGSTNFEANKFKSFFQKNSFSFTFGSLMNWPFIDFGRIRSKVDISKSEERQALLSYENTILEALKEVETALAAYLNEKEILKNVNIELRAINKRTKLQKDIYAKGLNSELSYLYEEKQLIEKKMQDIETQRTLTNDLISLYKALGGGEWEIKSEP